jgi:hypothetical protein
MDSDELGHIFDIFSKKHLKIRRISKIIQFEYADPCVNCIFYPVGLRIFLTFFKKYSGLTFRKFRISKLEKKNRNRASHKASFPKISKKRFQNSEYEVHQSSPNDEE